MTQKHKAKKRFSQNFLTDNQIIQDIINHFAAGPNDHVIEIGPGQGALTQHLVGQTASLDLIEIDQDLIKILTQKFESHLNGQLKIRQADVLTLEFKDLIELNNRSQVKILGNLPYNISTPLMFHCIKQLEIIESCMFMLQKEVVDRLTAEPNSKNYGRLSVLTQYYCQMDKLFEVPASAFQPIPKVWSAIIRLSPYQTSPYQQCQPELLTQVVTQAFSQRRKQIQNTLKPLFSSEQLEKLGIDPRLRAENLAVETYVALAQSLGRHTTK